MGQSLSDLGAFVVGMYEIVTGYNGAMGADVMPRRSWIYIALAGAAIIVGWNTWRIAAGLPRRRAVGLIGLMLVVGFAMWKTALVREHATFVLTTLLVAMFPLGLGLERRTWLACVLAVGIALAGSSSIEPRALLDVVGSVRSLASETADAFWPGRSDDAAERTRAQLQRRYRIDPTMLASLDGLSVHVDPYLTSTVYAYPEMEWSPLPVFQSYAVYTSGLDERNASVLRSEDAPQRILRSFRSADPSDLLERG